MTTAPPPATFPLGPFTPYSGNPILRPQGDGWESSNLYNPAALVVDDEVVLLYRAHAEDVVSHIGIARSKDGLHFERETEPVLSPATEYETRGVEDPRVSLIEGTYYMTYTGFDGVTPLLCLATSTDLYTWERHGPMLPEFDSWATLAWTKQLGRQSRPHNKAGVIWPEKIDGLYWMWFGEGAIYYATSPDLKTWTAGDQLAPIHTGTPGSWDQDLVEIGPPPVLTEDGKLLFLTNGARIMSITERKVDYRCGQILIDPNEPTKVVAATTDPWLQPQTFEDTHGLVANVTFVQGLVHFGGRWIAYYGQSDTTLAAALCERD